MMIGGRTRSRPEPHQRAIIRNSIRSSGARSSLAGSSRSPSSRNSKPVCRALSSRQPSPSPSRCSGPSLPAALSLRAPWTSSPNPAVIAVLLKGGANPNGEDSDGRTLLQVAAQKTSNPAVAAAMLKGGVGPTAEFRGKAAFDLAGRNAREGRRPERVRAVHRNVCDSDASWR